MLDDQTAHRHDTAPPPAVAVVAPTAVPGGVGAWLARHSDLLSGCAAAVIVAGGVAYALAQVNDRITQLELFASQTAPIAVIDYAPVLEGLNAGAPPEALEAAFASVKELAEAHAEAGFVVINASFVEEAPERFRISVPRDEARDLTAAIAAARALTAAQGLQPAVGGLGPTAPPVAPPPASLGESMTPGEARALIGALQ